MASVSYAQARLLSHCDVRGSVLDSLPVDGFFRLLPALELEGDCLRYPIVEATDEPVPEYVGSGGIIGTTPVGYGASAEIELKRMVWRVEIANDIQRNLDITSVVQDQALALAQLVQREVARWLWLDTALPPEVPAGMPAFAAQNPAGEILPPAGAGTPLTFQALGCLRRNVTPWLPSSPLYFVMNSALYLQLHDIARAQGAPLPYWQDGIAREPMPHIDGVPAVPCDFIRNDEEDAPGGSTSVYLVRVGNGAEDSAKIQGVARVHPAGRTQVEVGPLSSDEAATDVSFCDVGWNLAFASFSRSSVARLKGVRPAT